jgi:hypothetical protein
VAVRHMFNLDFSILATWKPALPATQSHSATLQILNMQVGEAHLTCCTVHKLIPGRVQFVSSSVTRRL